MAAEWRRVEELFNTAAELPRSERAAFLQKACAGDEDLRREVESLLSNSDSSDPFIEAAVAAAALTRRLPVGQTVGPYRITGILGEGGMGIVYKAEDTRLRRTVALKFIKIGFNERFQREANAISSLNHPHIATLYDIGNHEGAPYLVLECVDGKPIRGPLPLPVALERAIEIASALESAHDAGIIHRDLKPGNILVSKSGVKVVDFGLARRARSAGSQTRTLAAGRVAGTAAYMSPEQIEGDELDARTDIFSFGCVLYELIAGRQAFQGKSQASVIAAVLDREPEPLTEIPDALRRVMCRCLRKDPKQRWRYIVDVKLALEDVRAGLDQGQEPRVPRNWLWPGLFLSMTAIAVAAVTVALMRPRTVAQPDVGAFAQITDDAGQEVSPSLSSDGKTLVYSSHAAGNWDIYLLRVSGSNPLNLTRDSSAADTEPAFSPDADRIAFRSERAGGGIFIMGATGESVRRLTDFCYLPAWSPDGERIACSTVSPDRPDVRDSISSQVYVIDVRSGNRKLITGGIMDAVQPSWSPNGRRVAFWGIREDARDIYTVSSDGGDLVPVTADAAIDCDPVWAPDGKHLYFSSNRGGAMNVWRVALDQNTGKPLAQPEPANVPSTHARRVSFARDGQRLVYVNSLRSSNLFRSNLEANGSAAGAPIAITQGLKEALYPSMSRDGAWIAFTLQGAHEDIAVASPDGQVVRRITDDAARDRAPRWSPNGADIAFMSSRTGRFEIWTIHADGSGLKQITDASPRGGVAYPLWSPDGGRIAYTLPDATTYIIDAAKAWRDQEPQLIRARMPDDSWFWANDWSRDGAKIAGTVQRRDGRSLGIAVYWPETGRFDHVTDFGELARWLPGHHRLLFHANGRIYSADVLAKMVKEVVVVPRAAIGRHFDVSSDGRTLVYTVESIESDIWMRTAERAEQQR